MNIILASLLSLVFTSCATRTPQFITEESLAIMQGPTGEKETEINVLLPREKEVRFFIREKHSEIIHNVYEPKKYSAEASKWSLWQVEIKELNPQHKYYFDVVDKSGAILDRREFATFNHTTNELHFAVASCLDDSLEAGVQDLMWERLESQKPEIILLIGDNVYADKVNGSVRSADAAQLWSRYVETRNRLQLFRMQKLIPIYATWDDHDYGLNDGDTNYTFKEESQKIFKTFWSLFRNKKYLKQGPGVSYLLETRAQKFFFLDDRSFRTENKKPGPKTGMLGKEQLKWIDQNIDAANATPAWIVNGTQIWADYHPFESYVLTHPEEFQKFKYMLNVRKSPVIFLTGDRHLTEISSVDKNQLGYKSYELTTSAIHAKLFPGYFKKWLNPNQIEGVDSEYNFFIIDSLAQKENVLKAKVKAIGLSRDLYSETIKVEN